MLPTNTNQLLTIEELQSGLTQEEIEIAQQDLQVLIVLNALINNNRDMYFSLLIQNGAKLPLNVDIYAILPPGVTLNLSTTQMPTTTTNSMKSVGPTMST